MWTGHRGPPGPHATFILRRQIPATTRITVNKRTLLVTSVRQDHEPPPAIVKNGWRFHHIGIPTESPRPGETYLPALKMYVSGFESSPYGIQWMRFERDSPFPEIVKSLPHVAFEVDDLATALQGKEILVEPNCPSPGVTVAMIVDDGAEGVD